MTDTETIPLGLSPEEWEPEKLWFLSNGRTYATWQKGRNPCYVVFFYDAEEADRFYDKYRAKFPAGLFSVSDSISEVSKMILRYGTAGGRIVQGLQNPTTGEVIPL